MKKVSKSILKPRSAVSMALVMIMVMSLIFVSVETPVNAAPGDEIKYYHNIPSDIDSANQELTTRRNNLIDYYVGSTINEPLTEVNYSGILPIPSLSPLGDFKNNGSTISMRRIAAGLLNLKYRTNYGFKYQTASNFPATVESWLSAHVEKYAKAGTEVADDNGDYDMVMKEMVSLLYLFKNDKSLLTDNAAYAIINQGLKYYSGNNYGQKTYFGLTIGGTGVYYPETENHVLMILSSYYLTNQWIYNNYRNDPRLRAGEYANTAAFQNSTTFENDLLKVITRITYNDFFETNARAYQAFSIHSLLNLYAFADSPKIVAAAKNALDYFAAKYAFQSFEGKRIAPSRRNIEYAKKMSIYENDPTLFMMAMLSGAYDWNDTITGNWATDKQNYFMANYGQGAGHALWAAVLADKKNLGDRAYSIPPQIHDFMLNKHSGYWARMQARYDESFYPQDLRFSSSSATLYPKYERATGNIKPAPELYFVTNKYANISGGTSNHYCTGSLQHYTPPGQEFDPVRPAVYNTISRPNMIVPKGHVSDWGTPSRLWGSAVQNDVMWGSNSEVGVNTDDFSFVSFAKANNVGTYKNFTYMYNIETLPFEQLFGCPAAWSQYLYNPSAPICTRYDASSTNCFVFFDMSKVPGYGYYVVLGWNEMGRVVAQYDGSTTNILTGRQAKNAFWEVVDSSRFATAQELVNYVLANNPSSWTAPVSSNAAKNPPYPKYKYKMTTGETVIMQPSTMATDGALEILSDITRTDLVESRPTMITQVLDANGNDLPLKDYQADLANPSSMPLIDVMEVDDNYNYTGVKYAYSTGDGRIQIYNPYVSGNNYLCIDSSNPANPVQFTQNTPWICNNPAPGTTVQTLNGDINGDGYEDIVQIFSKNGYLGYKAMVNNKKSVFSQSSINVSLGMPQSNTIKFVTGDFNGDGKMDIVRVWDNNGKVGLDYMIANGTGFTVTGKISDLAIDKAAVDFVAVDYNRDGKDDVVQVINNNNSLEFEVYVSNGITLNSFIRIDRTGLNGSVVKILTGDFDGDGYKDIAKLWSNGGYLAIDYVKLTQLSTWATYSNKNMGQGYGAVDYLVGDINGDGKSDIIQLWNNAGKLAIINYLSKGDGSFSLGWTNSNMGQGAGALKFIAAKVNNDNKTDIVQLFDGGGGKLGIINYLSNGTGYTGSWGTPGLDGITVAASDYFAGGEANGDSLCDLIQVKETSGVTSIKPLFSDGTQYINDVAAPKAVNISASSSVVGNKIYAAVNGVTDISGVKKVLFATWTTSGGQDDLVWHEGTYIGRSNWNVVINKFEHKNESGEYNIHAYGIDNSGNMGILGAAIVNILPDTAGPTASSITTSGSPTTNSYYKVTANYVSDPSDVVRVSFPTWTTNGGQDDLIWHEGVYVGNGNWEFTVNKSDHKNETGEYITHAYAWDSAGNYSFIGNVTVVLK